MSEKQFLFVGSTTDKEGATTQLKASGGTYRKKLLASNPENWLTIAQMMRGPEVKGVLVTLTGNDYRTMRHRRYQHAAEALLDALTAVPHVVFVHESVFFDEATVSKSSAGIFDDVAAPVSDQDEVAIDPWEDDLEIWRRNVFIAVDEETRHAVNSMLRDRSLNVLPYVTNAQRAVMATSFIEGHDSALLFRVYVPAGRLYADEADRLLTLFHDWLSATGRAAVRQDGYRTSAGQVYEFFGIEPAKVGDLERRFEDFSQFLELCVTDSASATAHLRDRGIAPERAASMITRYARDARRLSLDLRHAREDRIVQLTHLFENEVLEELDGTTRSALEQMVPEAGSLASILAPAAVTSPVPAGEVRITQQVFTGPVAQVVQNIEGTVNLGPDARTMLDLIAVHGDREVAALTSALHELEDIDARPTDRLTARQKLKAFLGGLAGQIPAMTMQTLQKYLEQKIGIG